jgi:hypothetical protein
MAVTLLPSLNEGFMGLVEKYPATSLVPIEKYLLEEYKLINLL